jgi:UDP-N-acetylglucosamine acyltransferase
MNVISDKISIGKNLKIGSFNKIEDNVTIGNNVVIGNNILIKSNTTIEDNVRIFDGVIIGNEPQDKKKYNGHDSGKIIIGSNTILREYVTINKSVLLDGITSVGKDCFLMSYCHVSHDTIIEDKVTLANNVQIGGYGKIGYGSFLGGLSGIHQKVSIGKFCMIGMSSKIVKDVLPFSLVDGNPAIYKNINLVGLRRNKFSNERIQSIKNFYNKFFSTKKIDGSILLDEDFLEISNFIKNSSRGFTT